jgi:hypothetical protein
MRLTTVGELEGPEITALRSHLADVPHVVRAWLTIEESTRRVLSLMVCVPRGAFEYVDSEHSEVVDALHGFQGELHRLIPAYIAPIGLGRISATETRGTTLYSIEHTPGVVVQ